MNRFDEEQRQSSAAGLVGLAIGLGLGAVILYAIDGPPRLPDQLPSWDVVSLTLQGSSVPYGALVYLLMTAAWAIWAWVVASLVLRLIVVSFDVLLHGAAWIRPLRSISDRMTLPLVRRLVDGAVVAILLVNLTTRSPSMASAAPLTSEVMVVAAESPAKTTAYADSAGETRAQEQRTLQYTVQPGDTLWGIAERFYGTGSEYPRLVEANLSRQMMDGRVFTQAGVILPGWVLLVPMPSATVEEVDGNRYYAVEAGDSLSGIAARLLGAETRWPEIFELNRGVARLEDGRVLQDPELIWPGLRLRLPLLADQDAEATQTAVPAGDIAASIGPPVEPSGLPTPAMTAVPAVAIERQPVSRDEPASPMLAAAAAIAAAAAAGGAAFAIRRRGRRSLGEPPIRPEPLPRHDDFAEAETARVLTHQMHGEAEPVTVVAEQAMRFLTDHGVRDLSLIMASQGRSATALTFSGGLEAQGAILELGQEFASRVGGKGLASMTADHDVLLQVGGVNRAALLALSVDQRGDSTCLLPLGVLAGHETLYANWRELGNVLIAGLPGGGSDVILTSVISGLAARRGPEELALYAVSSRRSLPAQLGLFPHQLGIVASDDEDRVNEVLDQVRNELIRRMQADEGDLETGSGRQEVVLVIGELAELKDAGPTLELIGEHGPGHGVRLLAATTNPTALDEGLLAHFGSRIVLQTLDDEESIHLVGQPNAADLGSGDILVRIDGRTPVQARGFRVSTEHLEGLLRLMHEAYGRGRLSPLRPLDDLAVGEALSPQREPPYEMNPEATIDEPLTDDSDGPTSPYDDESGTAGGDGQEPPNGEVGEQELDQDNHPSRPPEDEGALVGTTAFGARPLAALANRPLTETVGLGLPAADAHDSRNNGHQAEFADLALSAEAPAAGDETWDVTALVQVRCFGGLDVRSRDREITPTLEDRISFKSFELLAFLAAHPDGAVSKDKLLAALWPESDEERGGKSMGVAMVRLRALLSRQVPGLSSKAVRCERDGVCRVDSGLIWSDVQEFLSRCRTAPRLPDDQAIMALQRALALYRGDLLAGPGSRGYEWVDERDESAISLRETYREEYNRASLRLARLFCRDGEAAQAVPILKNLLKAEPTLEDVVRDLYRCYRQIGDLSSLIREERHLRQALQETYYDPEDPEDDPKQYQPEPETVELFEQIRAELELPGGPNQEIAGLSG